MAFQPYISISGALKRLRSPDFSEFDAASRRIAWDSIMATGSRKQIQEANDARDLFGFPTTAAPGEAPRE